MSTENSYEGEGCEIGWRSRLADRLRELLLPAATISIVSSVWVLGYLRAKESEIAENYSSPIRQPRIADEAPDGPAPTPSPVVQTLTFAADSPE